MQELWRQLRQQNGNYRCVICTRHCSAEPALCDACMAFLPWISPELCLRCGAPATEPDEVAGAIPELGPCKACANQVDPFHNRFALFDYAFPVDALLKQFKYQEKRAIGRAFGLLLGQMARSENLISDVDILLPTPLAWPRRRERGFNQAADLAAACSHVLRIPWSDLLLHRHALTPPLAGLSPAERSLALLGAFSASPALDGQRVVLVDDVLTSGATSAELCRELLDRGAASVSVWTVARATKE